MALNILLIGGGGREHALAWRLAQSSLVKTVFVCPGNAGTATLAKAKNVHLPSDDFAQLTAFALEHDVGLVLPGPEQPLVDGIELSFRKVGIPVFGPSALAARMEGSKAFSKAFMDRHAIPTAQFKTFAASELELAIEHVQTCQYDVVLKASGLAAGKGVLIPDTVPDAVAGLRQIMVENAFGSAGDEVVIEERLTGPEISVLAFSDGYTIVPLPAAQDHKRIGEGDTGANTGGMGAYAPAPVATPAIMGQIMAKVLRPTIDGMRKEGFPFVGMLFTGLMLTDSEPKVLEYNVRFGDPETEALMLLLGEDSDLAAIVLACAERRLDSVPITIGPGSAVSVVLASAGYPGSYEKGKPMTIGSMPPGAVLFHAGTSSSGQDAVTSGGRVAVVSAHAATLQEALAIAYNGVDNIDFEGKVFRRDIAHRALAEPAQNINGLTYAQAGVSIEAGNALVQAIKPYVRSTKRVGADAEIGGFGGAFDMKAAGYRDPVLVSGTDGVGTKLHVAIAAGMHGTVGIDLVAMSVNDLIVQGAEPLFFLDYFACSKLDVTVAAEVVKGIAEGCRQAGCALVGGETAEMPGMYKEGDYDLAGFAVGAVERDEVLPRADIVAGDVLLGLSSSGLHSNGFSLVRKIISLSGYSYSDVCPWEDERGRTIGQALLEPTRIYIKQLLPAIRAGSIKGLSHITGGGFVENVPRVLPPGLGCTIDAAAWEYPAIFRFLAKQGRVSHAEMARTFNNGIGMVAVVAADRVEETLTSLREHDDANVYRIGEVTSHEGVSMQNLEAWSQ